MQTRGHKFDRDICKGHRWLRRSAVAIWLVWNMMKHDRRIEDECVQSGRKNETDDNQTANVWFNVRSIVETRWLGLVSLWLEHRAESTQRLKLYSSFGSSCGDSRSCRRLTRGRSTLTLRQIWCQSFGQSRPNTQSCIRSFRRCVMRKGKIGHECLSD